MHTFCRRRMSEWYERPFDWKWQVGIKEGALMLWTVFMLVMLAWMLSLFLKFQLGVIPLVIVLTITLAFIKVLRRSSFI
jgi:hypothetical protein